MGEREAPKEVAELKPIADLRKTVDDFKRLSGLSTLRGDPRVKNPKLTKNQEHPVFKYFRMEAMGADVDPKRPMEKQKPFEREIFVDDRDPKTREITRKSEVTKAREAARAPNATWDDQMTAVVLEYYGARERVPRDMPDRQLIEMGADIQMTRIMTNVYGATEFVSTLEKYVEFIEKLEADNAKKPASERKPAGFSNAYRNAALEAQLTQDAKTIMLLMPYWGRVVQLHFLWLRANPKGKRDIKLSEQDAKDIDDAKKALQAARDALPAEFKDKIDAKVPDFDRQELMKTITPIEQKLRDIIFKQDTKVESPRHRSSLIEKLVGQISGEAAQEEARKDLAAIGLTEKKPADIRARSVHAAYINALVLYRRAEADDIIAKAGTKDIPSEATARLFKGHAEVSKAILAEHQFGLYTTLKHGEAGSIIVSQNLKQNPGNAMKPLEMKDVDPNKAAVPERANALSDFLGLLRATSKDPDALAALRVQRKESMKATRNYIVYMREDAMNLRTSTKLLDLVYIQPAMRDLASGIKQITQIIENWASAGVNWAIWGITLAYFFPALRDMPYPTNAEDRRKLKAKLEAMLGELKEEQKKVQSLSKTIDDTRSALEQAQKDIEPHLKFIEDMKDEDLENADKREEAAKHLEEIAKIDARIAKIVIDAWDNITVNMKHHAETKGILQEAQDSLGNAYYHLGVAFSVVLGYAAYNIARSGRYLTFWKSGNFWGRMAASTAFGPAYIAADLGYLGINALRGGVRPPAEFFLKLAEMKDFRSLSAFEAALKVGGAEKAMLEAMLKEVQAARIKMIEDLLKAKFGAEFKGFTSAQIEALHAAHELNCLSRTNIPRIIELLEAAGISKEIRMALLDAGAIGSKATINTGKTLATEVELLKLVVLMQQAGADFAQILKLLNAAHSSGLIHLDKFTLKALQQSPGAQKMIIDALKSADPAAELIKAVELARQARIAMLSAHIALNVAVAGLDLLMIFIAYQHYLENGKNVERARKNGNPALAEVYEGAQAWNKGEMAIGAGVLVLQGIAIWTAYGAGEGIMVALAATPSFGAIAIPAAALIFGAWYHAQLTEAAKSFSLSDEDVKKMHSPSDMLKEIQRLSEANFTTGELAQLPTNAELLWRNPGAMKKEAITGANNPLMPLLGSHLMDLEDEASVKEEWEKVLQSAVAKRAQFFAAYFEVTAMLPKKEKEKDADYNKRVTQFAIDATAYISAVSQGKFDTYMAPVLVNARKHAELCALSRDPAAGARMMEITLVDAEGKESKVRVNLKDYMALPFNERQAKALKAAKPDATAAQLVLKTSVLSEFVRQDTGRTLFSIFSTARDAGAPLVLPPLESNRARPDEKIWEQYDAADRRMRSANRAVQQTLLIALAPYIDRINAKIDNDNNFTGWSIFGTLAKQRDAVRLFISQKFQKALRLEATKLLARGYNTEEEWNQALLNLRAELMVNDFAKLYEQVPTAMEKEIIASVNKEKTGTAVLTNIGGLNDRIDDTFTLRTPEFVDNMRVPTLPPFYTCEEYDARTDTNPEEEAFIAEKPVEGTSPYERDTLKNTYASLRSKLSIVRSAHAELVKQMRTDNKPTSRQILTLERDMRLMQNDITDFHKRVALFNNSIGNIQYRRTARAIDEVKQNLVTTDSELDLNLPNLGDRFHSAALTPERGNRLVRGKKAMYPVYNGLESLFAEGKSQPVVRAHGIENQNDRDIATALMNAMREEYKTSWLREQDLCNVIFAKTTDRQGNDHYLATFIHSSPEGSLTSQPQVIQIGAFWKDGDYRAVLGKSAFIYNQGPRTSTFQANYPIDDVTSEMAREFPIRRPTIVNSEDMDRKFFTRISTMSRVFGREEQQMEERRFRAYGPPVLMLTNCRDIEVDAILRASPAPLSHNGQPLIGIHAVRFQKDDKQMFRLFFAFGTDGKGVEVLERGIRSETNGNLTHGALTSSTMSKEAADVLANTFDARQAERQPIRESVNRDTSDLLEVGKDNLGRPVYGFTYRAGIRKFYVLCQYISDGPGLPEKTRFCMINVSGEAGRNKTITDVARDQLKTINTAGNPNSSWQLMSNQAAALTGQMRAGRRGGIDLPMLTDMEHLVLHMNTALRPNVDDRPFFDALGQPDKERNLGRDKAVLDRVLASYGLERGLKADQYRELLHMYSQLKNSTHIGAERDAQFLLKMAAMRLASEDKERDGSVDAAMRALRNDTDLHFVDQKTGQKRIGAFSPGEYMRFNGVGGGGPSMSGGYPPLSRGPSPLSGGTVTR